MAVIDLTEDPRLEMAMAQNIGGNIGAAFGYGYQQKVRQESEAAIVRILQRKADEGDNYSDDQVLADLSGVRGMAETAAKQAMENLNEVNKARAAYWRNYRGRTTRDNQITQLGRLHTVRKNIYDQYDKADTMGDTDTMNKLGTQIEYIDSQIEALIGKRPETKVTGEDFDKIDITKLPAAEPTTTLPTLSDIAMRAQQFLEPPKEPEPPPIPSITPGRYVAAGMGGYSPDIKPTTAASRKQTKADEAIAKEIAPAPPEGLSEIWDELDAESRKAAMELMAKGAAAEQLIAHYRMKRTASK